MIVTAEQREMAVAIQAYLAWCFEKETQPRVDELAKMVGMSRSAFSRRYRRLCGESPSRTLKRGQTRYARELLKAGTGVNRAAYRAGFGSRRTIYRTFRRLLHTTPGKAHSSTAKQKHR
jgi:AraC family transcriptional regulator